VSNRHLPDFFAIRTELCTTLGSMSIKTALAVGVEASGKSSGNFDDPARSRRAFGVRKNASRISSLVEPEHASASRASVEKSSVPTWWITNG
jgi:hypothetical protein